MHKMEGIGYEGIFASLLFLAAVVMVAAVLLPGPRPKFVGILVAYLIIGSAIAVRYGVSDLQDRDASFSLFLIPLALLVALIMYAATTPGGSRESDEQYAGACFVAGAAGLCVYTGLCFVAYGKRLYV